MNTYLALGFLCCFVSYACAGGYGGPRTCKSGVIGPNCIGFGQSNCKLGYTCINRRCCRKSVCPAGVKEGGSCNLLPGQQKCSFGYDCINNFCCQSRIPPTRTCPMFMPPAPGVCESMPPPKIACTSDKQCGGKCCWGPCGGRFCV